MALLEGRLAACGAMMVEGGVAELGVEATSPSARGRGCQLALLQHRIDVAAELGCGTVFAEVGSGPRDFRATRANLLYAGFERAYGSRVWHLDPTLGIY